ncbi:Uncharacterized paraquat-inducible protein B [Photobacterium sp. SKA34]|nr:Uncharacterized paraquat-inducible protein B [Photobacterium sp. SKA34]
MQRLFAQKIYSEADTETKQRNNSNEQTDQALIRMDDWELKPEVQLQVDKLMAEMNADNFRQVGDYAGYKSAFLALNGFGLSSVDYTQPVDIEELSKLAP